MPRCKASSSESVTDSMSYERALAALHQTHPSTAFPSPHPSHHRLPLQHRHILRTTVFTCSIDRYLCMDRRHLLPHREVSVRTENGPNFSEPIIEVIRIIGHRHQEYCFRNIMSSVIDLEPTTTSADQACAKSRAAEPCIKPSSNPRNRLAPRRRPYDHQG